MFCAMYNAARRRCATHKMKRMKKNNSKDTDENDDENDELFGELRMYCVLSSKYTNASVLIRHLK